MLKIASFIFSPIQENTYILYNEFNECIIIDPGCYFDDEKDEMAQYIDKMDLKPRMLLNTHCHLDHIFGNLRFLSNGCRRHSIGLEYKSRWFFREFEIPQLEPRIST